MSSKEVVLSLIWCYQMVHLLTCAKIFLPTIDIWLMIVKVTSTKVLSVCEFLVLQLPLVNLVIIDLISLILRIYVLCMNYPEI